MLISKSTLGRQKGRVASSPASLLPRDFFHHLPPLGWNFGSKREALEGRRWVPLGPASSGQRDREKSEQLGRMVGG